MCLLVSFTAPSLFSYLFSNIEIPFFVLLFRFCSGDVSQIPHPGVDWKGFTSKLKELMAKEPKIFCPLTQTLKPWVDIPKLSKFYVAESSAASGGGCTIS